MDTATFDVGADPDTITPGQRDPQPFPESWGNASWFTPLPEDPDWWKPQAECRGVDPSIFFVEQGGDDRPAREVCDRCPVRVPCLDANIHEKHGMFGGRSPKQRRAIRAERRAAGTLVAPPPHRDLTR